MSTIRQHGSPASVTKVLATSLMLASLLTACSAVRSNVEVFHELPADFQGGSISILPSEEQKTAMLEFRTYAQKLAGQLSSAGFAIVEPTEGPRFVAFIGYAVGDGEQVVSSYSIPQFGVTGYSSSQTYGTINTYGNYGTYSGTTTYNPTYGVTGYSTGVITETYFPRAVVVDIYEVDWSDIEASPQVYHLVITSSGACGNLSQVIDEMLEAGFQQFPADNGSARQIDVSAEFDC